MSLSNDAAPIIAPDGAIVLDVEPVAAVPPARKHRLFTHSMLNSAVANAGYKLSEIRTLVFMSHSNEVVFKLENLVLTVPKNTHVRATKTSLCFEPANDSSRAGHVVDVDASPTRFSQFKLPIGAISRIELRNQIRVEAAFNNVLQCPLWLLGGLTLIVDSMSQLKMSIGTQLNLGQLSVYADVMSSVEFESTVDFEPPHHARRLTIETKTWAVVTGIKALDEILVCADAETDVQVECHSEFQYRQKPPVEIIHCLPVNGAVTGRVFISSSKGKAMAPWFMRCLTCEKKRVQGAPCCLVRHVAEEVPLLLPAKLPPQADDVLYPITDVASPGIRGSMCHVCCERPINTIIMPCWHSVSCRECMLKWRAMGRRECDTCSTPIVNVGPIFVYQEDDDDDDDDEGGERNVRPRIGA